MSPRSPRSPSVEIAADPAALAGRGAALFLASSRASTATRGAFCVCLAGGSTPRRLYEKLAEETRTAADPFPWERTHVFWGDERAVPPDHAESNYRMANEALVSRVPIPRANIHRIRGEEPDPHRAATIYEAEMSEAFAVDRGEVPRFDLILLGLGADGHTASLFPRSPALESASLVSAVWVEHLSTYRITLTPRVINHAARIVFLVSGADKAMALKSVLEGTLDPARFPAQAVQPVDGEVLWLADAAAASLLAG